MSGVTFQLLLIPEAVAALTYVTSVRDTTAASTTHNFSIDCGAGGNVVTAIAVGTGTISSVTIGGQTGTVQITQVTGATGVRIALVTASGVASGTQTVAVTMSVVNTLWDCNTYTLQGAGTLTPTATGSDTDAASGSSFNTSNVLNGCTLGYTICTNGGAVTWSGLTKDAELGAGVSRSSPAHDNYGAANASRAVTTSFGGANSQTASVWASWGP